jgi:DNA-binding HxlR family transcriptional regulator
MNSQTKSVSNQYALRVVAALRRGGAMRSNELSRRIDATNPMMFSRLVRRMERDGLVLRTVHAPGPNANVTYELTAMGQSLATPASELIGWIDCHQDQIEASREGYRAAKVLAEGLPA